MAIGRTDLRALTLDWLGPAREQRKWLHRMLHGTAHLELVRACLTLATRPTWAAFGLYRGSEINRKRLTPVCSHRAGCDASRARHRAESLEFSLRLAPERLTASDERCSSHAGSRCSLQGAAATPLTNLEMAAHPNSHEPLSPAFDRARVSHHRSTQEHPEAALPLCRFGSRAAERHT